MCEIVILLVIMKTNEEMTINVYINESIINSNMCISNKYY